MGWAITAQQYDEIIATGRIIFPLILAIYSSSTNSTVSGIVASYISVHLNYLYITSSNDISFPSSSIKKPKDLLLVGVALVNDQYTNGILSLINCLLLCAEPLILGYASLLVPSIAILNCIKAFSASWSFNLLKHSSIHFPIPFPYKITFHF